MRFSYIDEQGKEVEIGGTAQLASRIRLGAVSDETLLHDAATDKWAPARDHAIYRELAKTVGEPEPPPGVVPTEEPADEPEAPPSEPEPEVPEPPAVDAPEPDLEAPESDLEAPEPPSPAPPDEPSEDPFGVLEEEGDEEGEDEGDPLDLGIEFTFEGAGEEDEAGSPEPATGEDALEENSFEAGAMDLDGDQDASIVEDPFEMETGPPPELGEGDDEDGDGDEDEEGPAFDFGSGGLELEETEEDEEDEEEGADAGVDPLDAVMAPEDPGDFGDGSLVSGAADEDWARPAEEEDDSWELEEEEEEEEPGPARRRGGGEEGDDDGDAPDREAASVLPPRPQPAPSSSGGLLKLLVPLLILGAGGYLGYTLFFQGQPGEDATETAGPGPDPRAARGVPADLQEPFSQANRAAAEGLNSWIRGLAAEQELAIRPPEEWLDGIYLAHASRYPGVQTYWSGVLELVREVRETAPDRFPQAYADALETVEVDEAAAGQFRGWAREDWEWSAYHRARTYHALEEISNAALDLHALLLEREDDIRFELMEAQPPPDVQTRIDAQIDRITGTLDDLDALGEVTTERLVEILGNAMRQSLTR